MATSPPSDRVALYDLLVATLPGVERRGAGTPYTSVNGNMFSYLNADGRAALRLPAENRDEFIERYGSALAVSHGIVQKEYVAVPDHLLASTDELAPWFARSHRYALTLRPKATTRPKKSS